MSAYDRYAEMCPDEVEDFNRELIMCLDADPSDGGVRPDGDGEWFWWTDWQNDGADALTRLYWTPSGPLDEPMRFQWGHMTGAAAAQSLAKQVRLRFA